jgi:hypothetical protein
LIILHDSLSTDLSHIQAVADMSEGFGLFDYVRIVQRDGLEWIGQIVQPNQNISVVGERLNTTILHGLQLAQSHANVQTVESVQVFDLLLLGQYDRQRLVTPRIRPLPGAKVVKLDASHTVQVIDIPIPMLHADQTSNVLGELLNADYVPLAVDASKFNYHIAVMGGTGSGKSNVAANLIWQAAQYGKCVLVHDAKPDYRLITRENTDPKVAPFWNQFAQYGLSPRPMRDVVHIGFYGKSTPDTVDRVVGFHASDFEPEMLASLFFSEAGEQNQFEGFASAALSLKRRNEDLGSGRQAYSVADIVAEVEARSNPHGTLPASEIIHELTARAILRKVRTRGAAMTWLDAVGTSLGLVGSTNRLQRSRLNMPERTVEVFDLAGYVRSGRVIVIDYAEMDEQAYALILSYFLRACQDYCRARQGVGLVQLVDEAHRVFDNDSRHGNALGRAFERVMREGRSVDHSIILSLQNASQIPPRVMNNLNSKIVMRQNSRFEADAATQTMGGEFAAQAMRLGTGQALVSLHQARTTVLAQMVPAPFELQRTDNSNQQR